MRYLCVILLPLMTNILDYVAAAPYLYTEPLAMAMCATGQPCYDGLATVAMVAMARRIHARFQLRLNHGYVKQICRSQPSCQVTGLIALALCSLVCLTFLLWLTKRCLDVTGLQQRLGAIRPGITGWWVQVYNACEKT